MQTSSTNRQLHHALAAAPRLQPPQQQSRHSALRRRRCAARAAASDAEPPPIDTTYESVPGVAPPPEGLDPRVKEALERAAGAVHQAEQSMQLLHTLPSARLPSAWNRAAGALRPAAQFAALAAVCAAVHSIGLLGRLLGSLAVGAGIAVYGWRRSSLSASGAVAVSLEGMLRGLPMRLVQLRPAAA